MCIITMTALGTALGMSAAAISSATAASAAGSGGCRFVLHGKGVGAYG